MKSITKDRLLDWGWLAFASIPASILYFSNIGKWSIWHDESFTAMLISYDWGEVLRRTALDVHPPLYYLVLKVWTGIFGTSLVAMRSLSAICMLGVIMVGYFLVKNLFGRGAARLATLFMVIAPYIIRYAQEARMYALVALLLLTATYVLVAAVKRRMNWLLYVYALLMALAIYCHYYALFILPVHWLYVLLVTRRHDQPKGSINLFSKHWWIANISILVLLAPWLPTAFRQFTSIQGAFWILPVNRTTFLSTVANFVFYKEYWTLDPLQKLWLISLVLALTGLIVAALYRNKLQRRGLALLSLYAFLPPLIIFILSLPPFQPIYNNRYFALTAPAFYMLLAALVYVWPLNKWRLAQVAAITLVTVSLLFGLYNVRSAGNFNLDRNESYTMKDLAAVINGNYQEGDAIVSTNLSTYFDVRFYNQNPATVLLYVDDELTGAGNTSLVYDRTDILLFDYNDIKTTSGTVWLVTDSNDQKPAVPDNWQQVSRTEDGYAAIVEYRIKGGEEAIVCAQVITQGRNIVTGATREFATACLPEGWVPVSP